MTMDRTGAERVPAAVRVRRIMAVLVALCGFAGGADAVAQPPGPVGPYVVDFRVATTSLPTDPSFYPAIDSDALIPGRAWGGGIAGHIYPASIGPARVGIGAGVLRARGTASVDGGEDIVAVMTVLAPEVSFNFGSGMGWSYVGAGAGFGQMTTRVRGVDDSVARGSPGGVMTVNAGAGARWFSSRRLAFGFDVRYHRIAAGEGTPVTSLLVVSAGLSLR
jgi:hypothetical protein